MGSNDYYRFANTAQRQGDLIAHGRARMDTEKKNIDILARKLAEIIVRPKGDKKSKLSKLKTKRVIG